MAFLKQQLKLKLNWKLTVNNMDKRAVLSPSYEGISLQFVYSLSELNGHIREFNTTCIYMQKKIEGKIMYKYLVV